jgi:hypothetical protein
MNLSLVFIIPSTESASYNLHIVLSYHIHFALCLFQIESASLQIRVTVFMTGRMPQLRSLDTED